ncbi:MAG TPA: helix-turn-helix transcriptional regulator [Pseudonocardia sp.]|uniref:helix-turn-helix domain-containing protein n=1 Tax=Pseudonocardia sp. TaxID=60912 RepID=UPI002C7723FD|nr:helix-turn-helix transcriptional regulator [Pseudonocardia sp.]HTF53651.1 helix-turn-helix transcriptional regulator [Pseudonocardia sp.]
MTRHATLARRIRADGEKIQQIRRTRFTAEGQPWTQAFLAARVGIATRTLQYIEAGKRQTNRSTIERIAAELACSVDSITKGSDEE